MWRALTAETALDRNNGVRVRVMGPAVKMTRRGPCTMARATLAGFARRRELHEHAFGR